MGGGEAAAHQNKPRLAGKGMGPALESQAEASRGEAHPMPSVPSRDQGTSHEERLLLCPLVWAYRAARGAVPRVPCRSGKGWPKLPTLDAQAALPLLWDSRDLPPPA